SLLTPPSPRPPPPLPYTTLFRSGLAARKIDADVLITEDFPVQRIGGLVDRLLRAEEKACCKAGIDAFKDIAGHYRQRGDLVRQRDRKSTRLNSSHVKISYAVFCL